MAWLLNLHNCSKVHGMSILLKCFGLSFILNRKLGIHALLRHQRYLKHVHDNILQHLTTTSVFHFLSRAQKLQSSHAGKCPSRPPRLWELQSLQSLLGPEGVWCRRCRIPGLCRLGKSRDQKYSEIRFGGSEMTWRCHLLELLWDRLASHATHVTCFVMSLGKCSLALTF